MTRKAIAVISLAPGEIGYYDDYSRIYLSNSNPKATVYSGTNLYQIRKSIKSGRIRLVEGSLVEEKQEPVKTVEPKTENTEIEPFPSDVKVQEPINEIENSNAAAPAAETLDVTGKIEPECEKIVQVEEKKAPRRPRKSKKAEETAIQE